MHLFQSICVPAVASPVSRREPPIFFAPLALPRIASLEELSRSLPYIHDHPAPFSEQPQPKASLSLPRSLLTLASIWASSPPLVSQRRKPMSPNAMKSYGLPSSPLRAASPALLLLRNRLTMPWFPPVLYRWQQVPQIRSRLKSTSSNMATLTFSAAKSSSSFPASRRRSGMRSVSWSLSYGQPGGHMPGPTA